MLGTQTVKPARRVKERDSERDAETDLFAQQRAIDDAFLDQTARLFGPRLGRPLSREDARQIVDNLGGFFRILAEWERIDRGK
jgi:hypothetical protein